MGNRSTVIDSQTTDYLTNMMNQYLSVGDTWYDYDNSGNLIYDALYFYEYDAENRLVQITKTQNGGNGPLTVAMDTDLTFTTGGDANWVTTNDQYYEHHDSACSGDISDSQQSWIQTTVQGEGDITFYWKTSSESYDKCRFSVDGVTRSTIFGYHVLWSKCTVHITGEL